MEKQLTDKQLIRKHNSELKSYELSKKGYTGDAYSIKSKRLIKALRKLGRTVV